MNVCIYNNVPYHYEILETFINLFLEKSESSNNLIDLFDNVKSPDFKGKAKLTIICYNDNSFFNYIHEKYNNIEIHSNFNIKVKNFDYIIYTTMYPNDKFFNKYKKDNRFIFISHEISSKLLEYNNVYFLTPLAKRYICCDKLPFSDQKIKSDIPIFVVQGNIDSNRRDFLLLRKILEQDYEYEFKIKFIGRGKLPECLRAFENKITLKNNLNFIDYHKEFLDAYCILPLISKETHPQYYKKKLTSSINYGKGYNLKFLIDKDLNDIYLLKDAYVYDSKDVSTLIIQFKKVLQEFIPM